MIVVYKKEALAVLPHLLNCYPIMQVTVSQKFGEDHLLPGDASADTRSLHQVVVNRIGMGDRIPAVSLVAMKESAFKHEIVRLLTSNAQGPVDLKPTLYSGQQLSIKVTTRVLLAARADISKATTGYSAAVRSGGIKQEQTPTKGYEVENIRDGEVSFYATGPWDIEKNTFEVHHYEARALGVNDCALLLSANVATKLNNPVINTAISSGRQVVEIGNY